MKPEGFSFQRDNRSKIWVAGWNIPGLMYGILESHTRESIIPVKLMEEHTLLYFGN